MVLNVLSSLQIVDGFNEKHDIGNFIDIIIYIYVRGNILICINLHGKNNLTELILLLASELFQTHPYLLISA